MMYFLPLRLELSQENNRQQYIVISVQFDITIKWLFVLFVRLFVLIDST